MKTFAALIALLVVPAVRYLSQKHLEYDIKTWVGLFQVVYGDTLADIVGNTEELSTLATAVKIAGLLDTLAEGKDSRFLHIA